MRPLAARDSRVCCCRDFKRQSLAMRHFLSRYPQAGLECCECRVASITSPAQSALIQANARGKPIDSPSALLSASASPAQLRSSGLCLFQLKCSAIQCVDLVQL